MMYSFMQAISAITFDDFNTLRYSMNKEDIIYPILRAFRKYGLKVEEKDFLSEYYKADRAYRKSLQENFRESLLDNIIMDVLISISYESPRLRSTVRRAVNEGLATRKTVWYPDALSVLKTLRERSYKLGLITNTHWRIPDKTKKEFEKYFDVITLSYEHGFVKPHPSIFIDTLKKLRTNASDCLHVGDDPIADIRGAKSVGMRTVFIKRREIKTEADIEIKQLIELTTL